MQLYSYEHVTTLLCCCFYFTILPITKNVCDSYSMQFVLNAYKTTAEELKVYKCFYVHFVCFPCEPLGDYSIITLLYLEQCLLYEMCYTNNIHHYYYYYVIFLLFCLMYLVHVQI